MQKTIADRFIEKFVLGPVHPTLGACWPWTGAVELAGYGQFWADGRQVKAHRFAYELWRSPIPDGLELDHLCHNNDKGCSGGRSCLHRRCVNPAHLEPVTHRENLLRGNGGPVWTIRETPNETCQRGHSDWYVKQPDGRRRCRECKRLRDRLAWARGERS